MRANEKKCLDCGKVKHLVLFSRDAKRADGRQVYCKLCMKPRYKAYRNRFTTVGMSAEQRAKQTEGVSYAGISCNQR